MCNSSKAITDRSPVARRLTTSVRFAVSTTSLATEASTVEESGWGMTRWRQYNPCPVMNPAHRLAAGVSWIDLQFLGRPKRIAAALLQGAAGAAIVDPGPTSCLPVLEQAGAPLKTVSHLLLTHIHLDHAGAAGTIARRHPAIRVVVHQHGAPHLVDPTKLLASATRLYGADMDRLWGAVEPVPPQRLQ